LVMYKADTNIVNHEGRAVALNFELFN
jgi:hypothetical protein